MAEITLADLSSSLNKLTQIINKKESNGNGGTEKLVNIVLRYGTYEDIVRTPLIMRKGEAFVVYGTDNKAKEMRFGDGTSLIKDLDPLSVTGSNASSTYTNTATEISEEEPPVVITGSETSVQLVYNKYATIVVDSNDLVINSTNRIYVANMKNLDCKRLIVNVSAGTYTLGEDYIDLTLTYDDIGEHFVSISYEASDGTISKVTTANIKVTAAKAVVDDMIVIASDAINNITILPEHNISIKSGYIKTNNDFEFNIRPQQQSFNELRWVGHSIDVDVKLLEHKITYKEANKFYCNSNISVGDKFYLPNQTEPITVADVGSTPVLPGAKYVNTFMVQDKYEVTVSASDTEIIATIDGVPLDDRVAVNTRVDKVIATSTTTHFSTSTGFYVVWQSQGKVFVKSYNMTGELIGYADGGVYTEDDLVEDSSDVNNYVVDELYAAQPFRNGYYIIIIFRKKDALELSMVSTSYTSKYTNSFYKNPVRLTYTNYLTQNRVNNQELWDFVETSENADDYSDCIVTFERGSDGHQTFYMAQISYTLSVSLSGWSYDTDRIVISTVNNGAMVLTLSKYYIINGERRIQASVYIPTEITMKMLEAVGEKFSWKDQSVKWYCAAQASEDVVIGIDSPTYDKYIIIKNKFGDWSYEEFDKPETLGKLYYKNDIVSQYPIYTVKPTTIDQEVLTSSDTLIYEEPTINDITVTTTLNDVRTVLATASDTVIPDQGIRRISTEQDTARAGSELSVNVAGNGELDICAVRYNLLEEELITTEGE